MLNVFFTDLWEFYLPYLYSCISLMGCLLLLCKYFPHYSKRWMILWWRIFLCIVFNFFFVVKGNFLIVKVEWDFLFLIKFKFRCEFFRFGLWSLNKWYIYWKFTFSIFEKLYTSPKKIPTSNLLKQVVEKYLNFSILQRKAQFLNEMSAGSR